jgi:hypothetical protein
MKSEALDGREALNVQDLSIPNDIVWETEEWYE